MNVDLTLVWRLGVSALVVTYLLWGPIEHQVLERKHHNLMMTWRMYSGAAREVCDVRYYAVEASGTERFVDRFEALGYAHVYDAKRAVRRIGDRAGIVRQGQQICREALPRGESLTAVARCASYGGWKPETFDEPICVGRASVKP